MSSREPQQIAGGPPSAGPERGLLRAVLDASPVASAVLDRRGAIVLTNRAWDELDATRGDRAKVGADYVGLVVDDRDSDDLAVLLGDVLAGRRADGEVDHACATIAGDRWLRTRLSALPAPHEGALVVHTDITLRRQASALELRGLEQARRDAQVSLAAGLAHDFNNLLTGVTANVGFLRMCLPPDPNLLDALTDIDAATTRATELCKQMLVFSGRGRFVLRRIGLAALVRDTAHLVRMALPRDVTLHLDLDAELPELDADAGQLQQLVTHLLVGAAEALPPGGGAIRVRVGVAPAAGDADEVELVAPVHHDAMHVALAVSDHGPALEPRLLRQARDPFVAASFVGRGLPGLLSVVRNHHGGLYAAARADGTRFRVVVPVGLGFHLAAPAPVLSAPTTARRGATSLLVVDDEELLRRTLARVLEHHGHRVVAVASGTEALAEIGAAPERYHLVLLDLTMPRPDGVETFHGLRRLAPRLPVVVMSGFAELDVTGRFGSAQPDGYLQKPVDIEALIALVNRTLRA